MQGRLIQLWMYKRSSPNDNHYAHPLDFVPFVDLNKRKVCPRMQQRHTLADGGDGIYPWAEQRRSHGK